MRRTLSRLLLVVAGLGVGFAIVELAVRNVIHGCEVHNKDALANPEALALYEDLEELKT